MSRLKSLFSEPCQRTATIHTNCSCMHKYIVRENLISFQCIIMNNFLKPLRKLRCDHLINFYAFYAKTSILFSIKHIYIIWLEHIHWLRITFLTKIFIHRFPHEGMMMLLLLLIKYVVDTCANNNTFPRCCSL